MKMLQDFIYNSVAMGLTAAGLTLLFNTIFGLGIGLVVTQTLSFLGHRSKGQP